MVAANSATDNLREIYADWSALMGADPNMSVRIMRALFDEWHKPTAEPEDVTYREATVGGVPGIWCLPVGARQTRRSCSSHMGADFAVGSASSHRKLAGHLAKRLGAVSFVLDYRRAPEHPHPAQVEDGVAVSDALVASGAEPADITTVGDSAGGNLAIAIPLALKDQGKDMPGSVIAFSPWLDMENLGETLKTNAEHRCTHHRTAAGGHDRGSSGRHSGSFYTAGEPAVRRSPRLSTAVYERRWSRGT